MAALYGRDVNPVWPSVWTLALHDVPTESLAPAFLKLEQSFVPTAACPFPVPAQLRALLDHAKEVQTENEAENAWNDLLRWLDANYHVDIGIKKTAPILSSIVHHAARAAGGFRWIVNCAEHQIQWAKRHFVEDFLRYKELPEADRLLGDAEAKHFLKQATASVLEIKPLAPGEIPPQSDALLHRPMHAETIVSREMTDEEWDARAALLKKQAAYLLAKRGV